MDKTVKAVVAIVDIGHHKIQGLMLPNGDFAIAVPQVAEMFGTSKNTASRDFKRLLGDGFRPSKTSTELGNQKINVINLAAFEQILTKLDRDGNIKAQSFRDDLTGLALYQLFCDAFGIKRDEIDRQNWLKERQDGKFYRRSLTDAVKHLIEQGKQLNYGLMTLQTYSACKLSSEYAIYRKNHKDSGFRNTLDPEKLRSIAKFEELVADYIMVDHLDPESAMTKASRYIR
jgi:hypothetical protein